MFADFAFLSENDARIIAVSGSRITGVDHDVHAGTPRKREGNKNDCSTAKKGMSNRHTMN